VAPWGALTYLERELVQGIVSGSAATVGAVEDAVAVVRLLVNEELGDARSQEVEVGEGLVIEGVEASSGVLG